MSVFHSTVTRRDFMKALGLAGAGIGAAAALTVPQFHDLDELAATGPGFKRDWYVKERDLFNPTIEIDWGVMKRYNGRTQSQSTGVLQQYPSYNNGVDDRKAAGNAMAAARLANQDPGYSQKFQALNNGKNNRATYPTWTFTGTYSDSKSYGSTNTSLGLPKWTGTPEEAYNMFYSAMRYYGYTWLGVTEIEDHWRNQLFDLYSTTGTNSMYTFENVDAPYIAADPTGVSKEKWVIPTNVQIYGVAFSEAASPEARKCPSAISNSNNSIVDKASFLRNRMAGFLNVLGYHIFGNTGDQSMPLHTGIMGPLTGYAEASRQNNYTLTSENGPHHNDFTMLTDFAMSPTKPMDAGIWKFCAGCATCAKHCMGRAISLDKEPTYDIPTTDGLTSTFHNPGPKAFWLNWVACATNREACGGDCWPQKGGRMCWIQCPMGNDKAAMIHALVRTTVSQTSIFNSFFATMEEKMSYGIYEPDDWWKMSLPVYGQDSTIGAAKGGYAK
ncbi:reductive dehalogenase [Dehalogenimonas formicexedens]|uniref:Reductive dehalogenase n=1 Tax=Dehalogenimonas formicexedens TaxID=1839801 RepID=A0A1P8F5C6_9CHLR|nr:reductive dehalogenase [Dehalogenimonas formicexedens]APV43687.1 reductive dehalogenase [Dehalogenimonas formicexedens]